MTRGEVWWADLGVPFGSEPGFKRPVLVVQGDEFNASEIPTVVIVPLTTSMFLAEAPGNVFLTKEEAGLTKDSVLVTSHLNAIDRARLVERASKIEKRLFGEIEEGIRIVLGMKKGG